MEELKVTSLPTPHSHRLTSEIAYLAYAYGPLVSYLFAWTAIIALKPGGNAVISLIFAEYLNRIIWHTGRTEVSPDAIPQVYFPLVPQQVSPVRRPSQWAIKVTAIAAVALVTLFCVAARKLGTRIAVVFTTIKVGPLLI